MSYGLAYALAVCTYALAVCTYALAVCFAL